MKTLTEYRENIKTLLKKSADIDAKVAMENRDISAAELSVKNEMLDEVEHLRAIVATQERQERIAGQLESAPAPASRPGPQAIAADRPQDRFHSFGEQLLASVHAARPGGQVDPRLYRSAATGLNETVPSDGGFLVQQDFSNELLQDTFATGVLASRCRRIPLSGNANSIKLNGVDETSRASTRYGGVLGYWIDEAAQKTSSKPKFRKIELSLKKLIGLCYATDELLQDASALEGFIRQAFPGEFGFLLDDAIIRGSGAGQPLGILNAGCLVTVSKEAGQAADTVVAENIFKMYARMFPASLQNAVWLVNQAVWPQLFQLSLSVGTGGGPLFVPAGGIAASPYNTLLGRPILPLEQCSALGDVGDIIFADLGGYLLAEKGGIQSAMSIHLKFDYDESVFRFVMRVDGQPLRAAALTPYKGSDTLSHFVTLDAR